MDAHRICRRAFRELDGEGARRYGGRWNSPGQAIVYASSTLALAAIEYLIHLDSADAPDDLVAIRIAIPDDVSMTTLRAASLPSRWQRYPAPPACHAAGDAWRAAGTTAIFRAPSAAIPEESNLLLNPQHPDFHRIKAVAERHFHFDQRLLR